MGGGGLASSALTKTNTSSATRAASGGGRQAASRARGGGGGGEATGARFDRLLGYSGQADAGLEPKTEQEYRQKRQCYLDMVDQMRAAGKVVPADGRHVTLQLLVAFSYYLCEGDAAVGRASMTALSMRNYRRAVLRACEAKVGGWTFDGGDAAAAVLAQHDAALEKMYEPYKLRRAGLNATEVAQLAAALDEGDDVELTQKAILLMAFWQGSRGKEVGLKHLRNVDLEFKFDDRKRVTWAGVLTYGTKANKRSGIVKEGQFFSQYHPEFAVDRRLDAASALYKYATRFSLLPTKAELAARAAWMRRPVKGVALGRPLFDGSRAAAGADGISKWLKKLASEVLPAARAEEISSKSLRQGAATDYHEAGVPKADAMRQLGHASLSSHMRYVREGGENRGVGSGQQTLSRAVATQLRAARRK
jgi:integrase